MKNKQAKKLITAGLVVALGLGGAVLTAGPAFAASANTGAKSCAAGGAATEAESTLDTTHTIFRWGLPRVQLTLGVSGFRWP
ncbi:hypothetical protein SAMN05216368_1413 [Cryobacterium flavum]|uniref:Uncharacterized protein n=1 Tax=Cryobacterium flavum TaxID=1424659 RepID=A0A5E9G4P2_9MICO|nr:hypothetical protein SAMN05216368_1413 [Cryobacterium flavum]